MNIIGQSHVVRYLKNGLQQNRLSPSLLFMGAEGVGKRTTAFELAKSLVCLSPKKKAAPHSLLNCDACDGCHKVIENNHPDLLFIDKGESQNTLKIESVRHLTKFFSFKPTEASKRIVIIDEANTLTNEAANALLKICEEPPPYGQIVLLTNDSKNLPSTLLSRCALLTFQPFGKAPELSDEKSIDYNLTDTTLDEFFESLDDPRFRREGRKKAEQILNHLIETAQKKLEEGDLKQSDTLQTLLMARKQIDHYVSPRLVLENVFLTLQR